LFFAARPVSAGARIGMSTTATWIVIGGVASMALGVLVGLQPIIAWIGRVMRREAVPLPVRMAGACLMTQPAATLRLLIGLALLVLVAGVSSGVLRDLELRSKPIETNYSVDVEGASVPDGGLRQRIFDLPARFKWTVQTSVLADTVPGSESTAIVDQARAAGLRLVTMSCASLRALLRLPVPECRDGELYRMTGTGLARTPYEITPGVEFSFDRGDGSKQTLTVPDKRVIVPDDAPFPIQAYGALYLAHDGPAYRWTPDSYSSFLIDPDPAELSASRSRSRPSRAAPRFACGVRIWTSSSWPATSGASSASAC
jgi:hypothetical protein